MPPPPSKKRKLPSRTHTRDPAPETIVFDPSARETYLTGFHARKVARAKAAQEESARRERAEKVRVRAEMRKQRREELEQHVKEVDRLVRQANGDVEEGDDESGSEDDDDGEGEAEGDAEGEAAVEEIRIEDEYVDEDKYTTVTVESVGISREGFTHTGKDKDKDTADAHTKPAASNGDTTAADGAKKKRVWTKQHPKSDKPRKKKQKFRYETKAERKVERAKQGMKKRKAAQARKDKSAAA